jgi:hypothetical protein
VTDRQHHMINAGTLHLAQKNLQDGHVVDRHERFREDGGVGGKAGSSSTGKDYCSHIPDLLLQLIDKTVRTIKGHKGN